MKGVTFINGFAFRNPFDGPFFEASVDMFHNQSRTRDEMTHREWNNAVSKRLGELREERLKAREHWHDRLRATRARALFGVAMIDPRHGLRLRT